MAYSYNMHYISGRLVRDPEASDVNGKRLLKFCVAVNRKYRKDQVDFFDVVAWGKIAEIAEPKLCKGQQVDVRGETHIDKKKVKETWYTNVYINALSITPSTFKPEEQPEIDEDGLPY